MQTVITSNFNYNIGTSQLRNNEGNSESMAQATGDVASAVDQENHRSANKQALILHTVSLGHAKNLGLVNLENLARQKTNAPINERSTPGMVRLNSEAGNTLGNSATRERVRRWARGRVVSPPRPRIVSPSRPRPVYRRYTPLVARRVDPAEMRRHAARREARRQAAQRAEQKRQDAEHADRLRATQRAEQKRQDAEHADRLRATQRAEQKRKDAEHADRLRATQRAEQQRKDAQDEVQVRAVQRVQDITEKDLSEIQLAVEMDSETAEAVADTIDAVIGAGVPVGIADKIGKIGSLAERILAANRTHSGDDPMHRAASFLTKEQLETGISFMFTGGDGVVHELLQIFGQMNDKTGIFEYIVHPRRGVTYQRFIPGGKITGLPTKKYHSANSLKIKNPRPIEGGVFPAKSSES